MKLNTGLPKEGEQIESTSSDESDSDEFSDTSMSDSDDSDSDNDKDALSENTANVENAEEDEEVDDEVVKAILKSKDLKRNHPPTINLEDTLADICFHPIKDIIALASVTGDVLLYKYNNEENELLSTIELHEKACRNIEFDEDGGILFSAGKDKSIILTDFETQKMTRIFENAHEYAIYSMHIVDQNTFVTGDDEGTVKMWDIRQGNNPIFSLKEMDDFVSAMITNDDKKFLVCSSGDGTLTTLNLRSRKLHVQTEDYPQELTCLGLFKNGRKILAGGSKGNLYLFNWGEFGLHSDEIPSLTKKSINCMIPVTENIVITGGEDKVLRATSIFPNKQLGVVGQHDLSVEYLDICNDGTIIASYSYDNNLKFWNIQYCEDIHLSSEPLVKGGKQKIMKHNLPSSKVGNASDFFSDL